MTNKTNRVLYTGVTSNLRLRVYQHRHHLVPGFTDKYNVVKLVYYECCDDIAGALAREKQIKAGPRKRKVELVTSMNPDWRDLFDEI